MRNYESIQSLLNLFESGELRISEGRVSKNNVEISLAGRGVDHYETIDININGKRCRSYFHNVVYALFHGIEELKKHETIDHLDGDKFNNNPSNLEGCTHAENVRRHFDDPDRIKRRMELKLLADERRERKRVVAEEKAETRRVYVIKRREESIRNKIKRRND